MLKEIQFLEEVLKMIDFSGVSLSFGVGELFTGVMGLLGIVGPFVLIGLAVMFAPKIIELVKGALETRTGHSLKGTLELQDREGNPIRSWRSRNAKY